MNMNMNMNTRQDIEIGGGGQLGVSSAARGISAIIELYFALATRLEYAATILLNIFVNTSIKQQQQKSKTRKTEGLSYSKHNTDVGLLLHEG